MHLENMKQRKVQKAKLNILTTLMSQLVATGCGIVIPRVMIGTFGSAVYGLTTSIAQFLSYISLLEGGIGRVARAELYGPLVEKDNYEISRVYQAIKHFFRVVAGVFLVYTMILACSYYDIAQVSDTGRGTVFMLVWVISISTLAKYLGGLANLTLLNASQKQYVGNAVVMATTMANAVLIILLTQYGCDVLLVKTVSSLVYIVQPACYAWYVKRHYQLTSVGKNRSQLKQKWTGIGQHIAYFLHTNTDIVLLTLFADLRLVAVYNVYRLVITSIRKIAGSFTGGMEAVFGELIARKEPESLKNAFWKYKFLLSLVTIVLFGTTAVLILPFVRLYTEGITDANYNQPVFAVVLLFAEAIDCVMHPCSSLPVSANKLKQTRWGSYGEAILNISLSMILIWWEPLLGIAIGTLCAAVFKSIFYLTYSAKYILKEKISMLMKNYLFTNILIGICALAGILLAQTGLITNYVQWLLWGVLVFTAVSVVTVLLSRLFFPEELKTLMGTIKNKYGK